MPSVLLTAPRNSEEWRPVHTPSRIPHGSEAAAAADQTLTGYRFVIVGLLALLSFSAGLNLFAIGPITPLIIDDYGITHSAAGLLTSFVALVHAAFAIPASTLVGRVGLKKLIAVGSVAGSAPILSFMAADSFAFLLALRGVYGVAFVVLVPAIGPLFMQWFRPRELPLVNGTFLVAFSLGITLSAFIVGPLSEALGWEVALSAFGGVSLLAAVSWLILGRAQRNVREIETHSVIERISGVLRSRSTLLLVVADAGPFTLLTVALAWLPTFYNEVHGIPLAKAGALMGLLSLAGVVSLVAASLLATRVHRRRPFLIIPGILAGFAGLGAFLLADSVAVYVAVVALGFACWFYVPVLMTIPMELYPTDPRRVAVVFATLMTSAGIANFIAPLSVGAITDVTGSFVPGLTLFAILAWSLAIAGFLLPETGTTAGGTTDGAGAHGSGPGRDESRPYGAGRGGASVYKPPST